MKEPQQNGNRLEALKRREAEIRRRIAAERVKQQRRRERDREKLAAIVGTALLEQAARVPDFELMLKQTLRTAVRDEPARQFLSGMGWL